MTGRVFLDTNVLLYTADRHDPVRQSRCRSHLKALAESGRAVISTQVLQEFYAAATRKLGIAPPKAREILTSLRRIPTVTLTPDLIDQAIACHQADRISFWDALIIVAAGSAGCSLLLSEDLNAGQIIRGVRVESPATWEVEPGV